jgi:hypothetical protein
MMRGSVAGVFLCLWMGALGCSQFIDPFDFGEVEVVAETRSGEGVPGMDLLLFMGTRQLEVARTTHDGRHLFRFVPHGNVGLFAIPPGGHHHLDPRFTSEPYTFTVREGDRRSLSFTLLRQGSGSVEVRAEDPAGEPIEGVRLHLSRVGPPGLEPLELEAETDGSGEHSFEDVPFGFYEATVLAGEGYLVPDPPTQDGIIVDDGSTERVELTLERS